jgi:uncharacterized protein YutE (UPF0331/DUF86 family)
MSQSEIIRKVNRLKEYIDSFSEFSSNLSTEQVLSNEKRSALERAFQLIVDEAIDINSAITYIKSGKVSDSYRSTFTDLAELGVIPDDFSTKISQAAFLRNSIVHDYEKMDKAKTLASMMAFHKLFQEYLAMIIENFVNKKEDQ